MESTYHDRISDLEQRVRLLEREIIQLKTQKIESRGIGLPQKEYLPYFEDFVISQLVFTHEFTDQITPEQMRKYFHLWTIRNRVKYDIGNRNFGLLMFKALENNYEWNHVDPLCYNQRFYRQLVSKIESL